MSAPKRTRAPRPPIFDANHICTGTLHLKTGQSRVATPPAEYITKAHSLAKRMNASDASARDKTIQALVNRTASPARRLIVARKHHDHAQQLIQQLQLTGNEAFAMYTNFAGDRIEAATTTNLRQGLLTIRVRDAIRMLEADGSFRGANIQDPLDCPLWFFMAQVMKVDMGETRKEYAKAWTAPKPKKRTVKKNKKM